MSWLTQWRSTKKTVDSEGGTVPLEARTPAVSPAVNREDWIPRFSDACQKLSQLIQSSEDDYLMIGEKIQNCWTRSKALSAETQIALDLISGSEMFSAITDLNESLTRIGRYLQFSSDQATENNTKLLHLIQDIQNLSEPLQAFDGFVKRLDRLALATKIENARLSHDRLSFDSLITDIETLSERIRKYVSQLQGHVQKLGQLSQNRFNQMTALIQTQQTNTHDVIFALEAGMELWEDSCQNSLDMSNALNEKAAGIETRTRDIVTQMQFHDISRQMIEHVQSALLDLNQNGEPGPDGTEKPWAEQALAVVQLQISQLGEAKTRIYDSVSTMLTRVSEIAATVDHISGDTRLLIHSNREEGSISLDSIQESLSAVDRLLAVNSAEDKELRQVMHSVIEGIDAMSGFVKEIEEIGAEIELISFNGQVHAAHLQDEGAALGVLANSVHKLAIQCKNQVGQVAGVLQNIVKDSEDVNAGTSAAEATESQVLFDEIRNELQGLFSVIQNAKVEASEKLAHAEELSALIHEEALALVREVTIHETMNGEIESVMDELSCFVNELKERGVQPMEISSGHLDNLQDRYTMEMEREIHDAIYMGKDHKPAPAPVQEEMPHAEENDDFGDNVELF